MSLPVALIPLPFTHGIFLRGCWVLQVHFITVGKYWISSKLLILENCQLLNWQRDPSSDIRAWMLKTIITILPHSWNRCREICVSLWHHLPSSIIFLEKKNHTRWFKPWPFHPQNVGGHQQPLKGVTYTTWKGSMAQLPLVLIYHFPLTISTFLGVETAIYGLTYRCNHPKDIPGRIAQTLSRPFSCRAAAGFVLSQVLGEAPGSTDTLDAILKVGRV